MSEQALETQDEIQDDPEVSEVEIVIAGEEEPPSKPGPKGFYKRLSRVTGQRDEALDEATQERAARQEAEEREKLLRKKLEAVTSSNSPPKPEDFGNDADYEAAKQKYDNGRIESIAQDKARQIFEESQSETTRQQQVQEFEGTVKAHYERAEALQVPDYEAVEDKAMDALGDSLTRYIMAYHGKSEVMLYHLGAQTGKAQELRRLSESSNQRDHVLLAQKLTRLEDGLSVRPKHSPAPDPEAKPKPGDATPNDWQRKVDLLRDDVENGKATLKDVIALKREAAAAGAQVR